MTVRDTRTEARTKIAEYLKAHPEVSYKELAAKLGCAASTIATIAHKAGIVRQRKALNLADVSKLEG
jgi:DNA-binding MurR/RpiR family transcriptional regulator